MSTPESLVRRMTTTPRHDAEQALAASSSAFTSRSTLQQRVLSEEDYISRLSRLIQRDYFPDLPKLEAENRYLDAVLHADEPGGQAQLEAAARNLVLHEERVGLIAPTPGASQPVRDSAMIPTLSWTPRTEAQATPRQESWEETPLHEVPIEEGQDIDADSDEASLQGLTIADFQAKYTSEDNASFLALLEKGQRRKKEAYKWAYAAEEEASKRRRRLQDASNKEAEDGFQASLENAPSSVRRRLEHRELKLITSNGESVEQGNAPSKPTSSEPAPAADGDSASILWQYKARNALFYGPDADRTTTQQRTSSLPSKAASKADVASFLPLDRTNSKPGINFANTRLHEQDDDKASTGTDTPRSSRIDAAIGGWLQSSAGGSQASASDVGGEAGADRISEAYPLVSPVPSPRPGDLGEKRLKQLMTVGQIMGARAVGQSGSSARPLSDEIMHDGTFKMPPTPRRDTLARQLAEKGGSKRRRHDSQASHLRNTLSGRSALASPATNSRKRADMSPAAQNLLDRTTRSTALGDSLLGSRRRAGVNSSFTTPATERRAAAKAQHERLRRERWTPFE